MAIATPPAPAAANPWAIAAELLDEGSQRGQRERDRQAIAGDIRRLLPHVRILHPQRGEIAFLAWSWQLQLLALMVVERLLVILKARQLGVSWLAAIYALWVAAFHPGKRVLLISKGQKEADDLLAKVAFVFHKLPDWLRPEARVNARSISFPGIDSEIEALPATEGVGRSATASLVILDEHGHQRWARKIFLALKPVVEHGQLVSISTANGLRALHSQLYLDAKKGINGFRAVFIPWNAHPERDAGWRDRERAAMSALTDAEFAQEYPANDQEAFVVSGRLVFRHVDIQRQPLERGVPGEQGVTIFREPEPGRIYLVGGDTSEGVDGGDWSRASVIERDTGEQVAVVGGRWPPDVYAAKLDRVARRYARFADASNRMPVIVGVERNNHGHAVLLRLAQLHGGTAPYQIFRAKDGRLGWLTTTASRPLLVDQLEEAVRTDGTVIHDAVTVDEMLSFSWSDDGRPEAQEGYHDDAVIAHGIAIQMRRRAFGRLLDVRRPAA